MIVTTVYDTSPMIDTRANEVAHALRLPFMPRKRRSLAKLFNQTGVSGILVVSRLDVKWHVPNAQPFFFHPSMAQLRVKRMLQGEQDPLIEIAGIESGDRVIDCTAGMAADSIILSLAVEESGQVIALESNRILHYIVSTGLKSYRSDISELNEAMQRIRLLHEDHCCYLSSQPDRSVDVVYFDPMFRNPLTRSAALDPMRRLTNEQPISTLAIEHAKRVATKAIVLKEQKTSGEFERLGFKKQIRKDSKFTFGVMTL